MRREVWTILMLTLGLTLWALVCLMPLQLEWVVEDTRPLVTLAYLLPPLFLGLGTLWRAPGMLLCLFPASLVPAFLVLPEADQAVHASTSGWLSLALSVGMYVCVASAWCASAQRVAPGQRDGSRLEPEAEPRPALRRHLWWPYRLHFPPRQIALALLLVVPLYGLNFAEGAAAAYAIGFGPQAEQARVMANLIFMFVWAVLAYLFFFSPGLNLELEQREMDVALRRLELGARRAAPPWLLAMAVAAALALAVVALLWQTGGYTAP